MPTRRWIVAGTGMLALGGLLGRGAAQAGGASPPLDLEATLARIEAGTGGRLGVSVLDPGTGRRITYRAGERFPLCSTAKVLVCGALLARVDAGRDSLGKRVMFTGADLQAYSPATKAHADRDGMTLAALCQAALTLSDNTAANLLIARLGGPGAVTAFAQALGDPVTRLDRTEPSLNEARPGDPRDTTTPDAMVGDLKALLLGAALSPGSRDQLAAWMVANTTGDAKLRAGVPKDWRVGDKTGSGDHGTSNDVAVLWRPGRGPLVAAVFLTGAESVEEAVRSAAIAAVGRAAAAALGA